MLKKHQLKHQKRITKLKIDPFICIANWRFLIKTTITIFFVQMVEKIKQKLEDCNKKDRRQNTSLNTPIQKRIKGVDQLLVTTVAINFSL